MVDPITPPLLIVISIVSFLLSSVAVSLCAIVYTYIKWAKQYSEDRLTDTIEAREEIHARYSLRIDSLMSEAMTHLSSRSAKEAVEAQSMAAHAKAEAEQLKDLLRNNHTEAVQQAVATGRPHYEEQPNTITTEDGRVLKLVESPDDFF